MRRWYVIAVPYLWLAVFFLVPFFIVFKISLSDVATAMPPYVLQPPIGTRAVASSTAHSKGLTLDKSTASRNSRNVPAK